MTSATELRVEQNLPQKKKPKIITVFKENKFTLWTQVYFATIAYLRLGLFDLYFP